MSSGIIDIIKKTALEAFRASNPVQVMFGKVISVNPVQIKVGELMTLTQEFLVINGVLYENDTVTLIRCQGGQKFVVLGARTGQVGSTVNSGGVVTTSGNATASGASQFPFKGGYTKTSDFGWRQSTNEYHKGVDLVGKDSKHIYPINDGTVVWVKESNSGYGKHLLINHGDGLWSLYAHFSTIYVKANQTVNKDTILGVEGSTGNSTGSHLHLEVRKSETGNQIDPMEFLNNQ